MFICVPVLKDTDLSFCPKRLTLVILLPNSKVEVAVELLSSTLLLSEISLWADFKMPKLTEKPESLTKKCGYIFLLYYYTIIVVIIVFVKDWVRVCCKDDGTKIWFIWCSFHPQFACIFIHLLLTYQIKINCKINDRYVHRKTLFIYLYMVDKPIKW